MILIRDTDAEARHPWPEDVYVCGGVHTAVRPAAGDGPRPLVAFVQAYPPEGYMLGEGPDIAAAEDDVWAQFQQRINCPQHPQHGPFEPRHLANGSGYCTGCGTWFAKVLLDGPDDPGGEMPETSVPAEPYDLASAGTDGEVIW